MRKPSRDYQNYQSEIVDGKVVLTVCEPVAKSLAAQYSVTENALVNQPSRNIRKRINVDAVDVPQVINDLKL